MSVYFVTDPGAECLNLDSQITRLCLPKKVDCGIPNIVLVVPDGEQYHCKPCCNGDRIDYPIPFKTGDVIDLQTQIIDQYNIDPANPMSGFGTWIIAEVIDGSGAVVGNYTTFGSGYVGWSGRNSYQVIRLDTSIEDFPECFYVRYRIYKPGEPNILIDTHVSQTFKKETGCDSSVLVEGFYNTYDCRNQYYGEPEASFGDTPFNYSNKLRYYARLTDTTPEIEKTVQNGRTVRTKVTNRKLLDFEFPLPDFMLNYVAEIVLAAKNIELDGKLISRVSSVSPEPIEETCSSHLSCIIINECSKNC